jgi:oligopeptide transport system permease protein
MNFLSRKLMILLFSLWCVITVTFFLMHSVPGDPFIGDRDIPEEVLKSLYSHYGLDQPLWIQYSKYLKNILFFDLGNSIVYTGRPISDIIWEGLPISALIGFQALMIAVPSGILLGTWAALKRAKWQDHFAMILATFLISVPNFVLSSLLQYLFAVKLQILPVARFEGFEYTILPTIALAAMPTAVLARLTRSNMVEVLQQDYIRTALAKGLSLPRIALVHGLRNAILPVISYLGPVFAWILTGSFMIEKIFAIPGLGQWMIHSIYTRDYPMIMGLSIFFCAFLMLMVFLADIALCLLDPRVRKVTYERA